MADPAAIFEAERSSFRELVRLALARAGRIDPENVAAIEDELIESEVSSCRRALDRLGPPRWDPGDPFFVRQTGTRCMTTSLANALISMGERALVEDPVLRAARLTADVVARTSPMGKPGEYRSVDDLFKYLETGRLGTLDLGGARCRGDYRARLTCSLHDVCQALWTGRGRVVAQRRAHARLAFALDRSAAGEWLVLVRDPLQADGPGFDGLSLGRFRRELLWGPLKKVPRILGPHGLASLSPGEVLGHLERYRDMDDLGVDCSSALVLRAADAPPRRSPPPGE